jgi:hypothetical protein
MQLIEARKRDRRNGYCTTLHFPNMTAEACQNLSIFAQLKIRTRDVRSMYTKSSLCANPRSLCNFDQDCALAKREMRISNESVNPY